MRWVSLLALALASAACRPPRAGFSETSVEIPAPAGRASARSLSGCRAVATDMWGAGDRPDSSLSTAVRFDGAGHVVFAVEKRKLRASDPVSVTSRLAWSAAGELRSIDAATRRGSEVTNERVAFAYGPHHEVVSISLEGATEADRRKTALTWRGTFDAAPGAAVPSPPSLAIPGFYRQMPDSLASPSIADPMPPLSFTGAVTLVDETGEPKEIETDRYDRGLLLEGTQGGSRLRANAFDDRGRLVKSTNGATISTYTWDADRVVRETIDAPSYGDEVSYEYAADGRVARQHMVDAQGKPVADITWSDSCPIE